MGYRYDSIKPQLRFAISGIIAVALLVYGGVGFLRGPAADYEEATECSK